MTTPIDALDQSDCDTLRQYEADLAAHIEAEEERLGEDVDPWDRTELQHKRQLKANLSNAAVAMCGIEPNTKADDASLGCDDLDDLNEDLAAFEEKTVESFSEALVEGSPSFEDDVSRAENKRRFVHLARDSRERIETVGEFNGCDIEAETTDNPPRAPMNIVCVAEDGSRDEDCIDRRTNQFDTPGSDVDDVPWT